MSLKILNYLWYKYTASITLDLPTVKLLIFTKKKNEGLFPPPSTIQKIIISANTIFRNISA